ncbi:hypothetical protein FKP32DRAFT_1184149 [Trametes sanguinea]|nr:hypothetical protein FKP32DRAFT_1184149 [Trametes sanguinea]
MHPCSSSHSRCFSRTFSGCPWREATVAANGTSNPGSDMQLHLLGDGYHCADLILQEGAATRSFILCRGKHWITSMSGSQTGSPRYEARLGPMSLTTLEMQLYM